MEEFEGVGSVCTVAKYEIEFGVLLRYYLVVL